MMNRTITPDHPAHPTNSDQTLLIGSRKVERVFFHPSPLGEDCQKKLISECRAHENEVCGLITATHKIHYVRNVHEVPRSNFYFDQEEFKDVIAEILGSGHRVIGMFHTHPNGTPWPSPRDIVGWPNPALRWRYWIATRTDVIEWRLV